MILKVPSVECDGVLVMSDTKINLQILRRQCRMISTLISGDKTTPVDIIINRWGDPGLSKFSVLALQITGEEQKSKKKFDCKVGFDFLRSKWLIDGTVGAIRVNESLNGFSDFIKIISNHF